MARSSFGARLHLPQILGGGSEIFHVSGNQFRSDAAIDHAKNFHRSSEIAGPSDNHFRGLQRSRGFNRFSPDLHMAATARFGGKGACFIQSNGIKPFIYPNGWLQGLVRQAKKNCSGRDRSCTIQSGVLRHTLTRRIRSGPLNGFCSKTARSFKFPPRSTWSGEYPVIIIARQFGLS